MIVLSVGHHASAQGARSSGLTEYRLSKDIVAYIDHPDIWIVTDELKGTVDLINSLAGATLAAELHWNAGGDAATSGCETLYCPGSTDGRTLPAHGRTDGPRARRERRSGGGDRAEHETARALLRCRRWGRGGVRSDGLRDVF